MDWPKGFDGLCYGGDYNPEQWPERGLEGGRRADAPGRGQPGHRRASSPGPGWSPRRALRVRLAGPRPRPARTRAGSGVDLATPTASPPPWFGLAHPDALAGHGGRCPADATAAGTPTASSAPPYRDAAVRIAARARRALPGPPGAGDVARPQRVRDRRATATTSPPPSAPGCGERYGDARRAERRLDHRVLEPALLGVGAGHAAPRHPVPAQPRPDARLPPVRLRRAARPLPRAEARRAARSSPPTSRSPRTSCFGDWVPVEPARWAAEVDLVAIDHYPAADRAPQETAFAADLARAWAGGQPVAADGAGGGDLTPAPRMIAKRPGRMARHSLSHVARGSRGAMFFQWRASRGGAELFHSGDGPARRSGLAGSSARSWSSARSCPRLAEAAARRSRPGSRSCGTPRLVGPAGRPACRRRTCDYLDSASAAHRALWRAGVTADFAAPVADLSAYRLVLVPSLYLISDADAREPRAATSPAAARCWSPTLSGVADEHARVRLGRLSRCAARPARHRGSRSSIPCPRTSR